MFEYNKNLFDSWEEFFASYIVFSRLSDTEKSADGYTCLDTPCEMCIFHASGKHCYPVDFKEFRRYEEYLKSNTSGYVSVPVSDIKVDESNGDFRVQSSGGIKETKVNGEAKPMYQLFDPYFYEGVTKVLTYGALKYTHEKDGVTISGADNWRNVDRKEYERALESHFQAYKKGNKIDDGPKGSGYPHLWLAACNLMFLDWFDRNTPSEGVRNGEV